MLAYEPIGRPDSSGRLLCLDERIHLDVDKNPVGLLGLDLASRDCNVTNIDLVDWGSIGSVPGCAAVATELRI